MAKLLPNERMAHCGHSPFEPQVARSGGNLLYIPSTSGE